MWYYDAAHPLRRLFAGLTEQTFVSTLGVADPTLVDYLSLLLARFIHLDAVHRFKNADGKRLEEVIEMILEAEALPPAGRTRREYHRHIGDFTLFWTGVYPEALHKLRSALTKDSFVNYCEQGKRSYYIASTFEDDPYREEAKVLRRLSSEFELCAYGLTQVRREWEKTAASPPSGDGQLLR
jgi:aminopeptidase N